MQLQDKVAVITGGASGLGRAAVRRFVENGAKCAIFDMNADKGEALSAELGDSGYRRNDRGFRRHSYQL